MIFEYMLYVFIFIGFITGIVRGFKKELAVLISLILSLALVLYSYPFIVGIGSVDYPLIDLYSSLSKVLSVMGITYNLFEFIIFGVSVFLISFILLNKIFKFVFFNAKKELSNPRKKKNGFLGSIFGIFSGLVLSVFVMTILASSNISISFDGFITKKLIYFVPNLSKIFGLLGELI